jgi:hypothetical protein
LRRLKRGLEKAGLDPKFFGWPPEDDRDRAPFRGLKPLDRVDAGIFFGRAAPARDPRRIRSRQVVVLDARPDIAARLDAVDRAYLAACRAREEQERAEREARRREREEEQARRLKDAQNLATANRRIAVRTRLGLVAALALAAIAVWFAKDARDQTQVANEKTEEARNFAKESDQQKQAAQEAGKKARDAAEEAALREAAARVLLEIQSNPEQGLETAMGAFKQNLNSGKPLLAELYSSAWQALDAAREVKQIRKARPWLHDVTAIVPSPDGSRILIATAVAVQVFDLNGRQLIPPIADDEQISTESMGAAWQPTGERFVVAQGNGEGLRLYNADGTFVRTLVSRQNAEITACLFIDDKRVAAGTSDGKLIVVKSTDWC